MNDRLVFHDRLRWLPADIKSDNPHALTFLRLRRDHGLQWEIEACARNGIEFITVLRKTAVETFDRNEPDFRPPSA